MTTPKFVIDANILIAWVSTESPTMRTKVRSFFQAYYEGKIKIIAPSFILIETLNVLARKKHTSAEDMLQIYTLVTESGIELQPTTQQQIKILIELIYKHHMSAYDGLYISLSHIEQCPLITEDTQLLTISKTYQRLHEVLETHPDIFTSNIN